MRATTLKCLVNVCILRGKVINEVSDVQNWGGGGDILRVRNYVCKGEQIAEKMHSLDEKIAVPSWKSWSKSSVTGSWAFLIVYLFPDVIAPVRKAISSRMTW